MWTTQNRIRYDHSALRYPSDLTDDEWAYVEPLIPPASLFVYMRHVYVLYVMFFFMYVLISRCLCSRSDNLPPRSSVHVYLFLCIYVFSLYLFITLFMWSAVS